MNRKICIYHICSTIGDPSNGMVNVIPEHVKAQCKEVHACLINLKRFKFPKYNGIINCFNIEDVDKYGVSYIEKKCGKPDLYVIHGLYLPAIWKYWLKNIYKKVPYVIVPHGTLTVAIQNRHSWKKKIANTFIVKRIIKNAIAIHYLSEGEKNNSIICNKECFVCPNGITLPNESFTPSINSINLVYIGRIDIFHKGLDLLISGISKKKDYCYKNKVKVHIYGPTNSSDYGILEEMIKREGIEDIVTLNGPVFGIEKKKVLLKATFFIQTSRLEGLPMGILEAMSYGIPLLITDGTYLGDQISYYNNGCVSETSVEGVEKLISYAVKNIKKLDILSLNSSRCAEQYSWDVVGYREINEYKVLLNKLRNLK